MPPFILVIDLCIYLLFYVIYWLTFSKSEGKSLLYMFYSKAVYCMNFATKYLHPYLIVILKSSNYNPLVKLIFSCHFSGHRSNESTPSKSMSPFQQSSTSRPGSGRGSVINRLRIESSDDGSGSGITIAGIFVSANCSIILIIMASIFILIGAILTAISYRWKKKFR